MNRERLSNLQEKKEFLSDWEKDFLESLVVQFDKKGTLSERQIGVVNLLEEKTSPEAIAERNEWETNYKQSEREKAIVVAKYYKETGYFRSLADSILDNPEFVPEKRSYKKMAENKYALRVLAEYFGAPKYPNGSLVMLRAGADYHLKRAAGDNYCVVIASGKSVGVSSSAAKGAKLYKILPFGSSKVYTVEERHLKKARKSKTTKKVKKDLDNEDLF